jgi:hypothetical protein
MTSPNIVSTTSIYGVTTAGELTTSTVSLLSNATSSGKLYRVNTIIVTNVDGTNSANVTISYNTAEEGGGDNYEIASTIAVLPDSTLVVLGKDSSIYLQEDRSITGLASANSDLKYIISYEEIS